MDKYKLYKVVKSISADEVKVLKTLGAKENHHFVWSILDLQPGYVFALAHFRGTVRREHGYWYLLEEIVKASEPTLVVL